MKRCLTVDCRRRINVNELKELLKQRLYTPQVHQKMNPNRSFHEIDLRGSIDLRNQSSLMNMTPMSKKKSMPDCIDCSPRTQPFILNSGG